MPRLSLPAPMRALPFALLSLFGVTAAGAQSPQPNAVQLSAMWTTVKLDGAARPGVGIEAQFRHRFAQKPQYSFGFGLQYSGHKAGSQDFNIRGLFVEPRKVIDIGRFDLQPYIAGRLAVLQLASDFAETTNGFAIGGGGGIAYLASQRVIIDAGLALIGEKFSDITFNNGGGTGTIDPMLGYAIKLGVTVGLGK